MPVFGAKEKYDTGEIEETTAPPDPAFNVEFEIEEELPQFTARAPKAGRIITNSSIPDYSAKRLNDAVAKIAPSVEKPFYADITVTTVPKRKMLPPEVTKDQERRAQKEDSQTSEDKENAKKETTKETPERKKSPEEIAKEKRMKALKEYLKQQVTAIVSHPGAKTFPGMVSTDVQRVIRAYTSDNEIRGWQCTGLYAPPGEVVNVHVATAGISTGYKIRIGAHTDNLLEGTQKAYWRRFPSIVKTFSPDNSTISIANPFGGMIYVWAPKPPARKKVSSSSQRRVPQRVRFQFIGVLEAPQFVLGKTKVSDWKDKLRNAPAPWAELQGEYFSALVPSSSIRKIENPTELIEFWDKIIAGMDKFSGRKEKQAEIERIVFDVDSTGLAGHNDNPIVMPLSLLKTFLDLDYIKKNGSWGLFFYLARNRVKGEWTLYGNNDVPAALIALNAMTQATGKMPSAFFDVKTLLSYALTHPEDSGTAELIGAMIPPIEKFGWDPLERTFAKYNNAKKPNTKTEVDKYETFFALWSRETKCDLGKYFECFGFPYGSMQKARLGKLKEFESDLFPPTLGLEKETPDCFIGDKPLGSIEIFFADYNAPADESKHLSIDDFFEIPEEEEEGESTETTTTVIVTDGEEGVVIESEEVEDSEEEGEGAEETKGNVGFGSRKQDGEDEADEDASEESEDSAHEEEESPKRIRV